MFNGISFHKRPASDYSLIHFWQIEGLRKSHLQPHCCEIFFKDLRRMQCKKNMSLPLYLSYTLNFVQEDPPQVCHNPRCSSFKVLFCCQYFVAQLAKRQPVPNTVKIQMKHKLLLSSMFYNFAFCEIKLKKN